MALGRFMKFCVRASTFQPLSKADQLIARASCQSAIEFYR